MICFEREHRSLTTFYDFNNDKIDLDRVANPTPAYVELKPFCTKIPKDFFAGMQSLVALRGDMNNVFEIESGAFRNCTNLCSVPVFQRVAKTGEGVFQGCSSLREIELPPTMFEIPPYFFDGCESLTEVKLPEYLVSIGYAAFRNSGIKRIKFPRTLRHVADFAFYGAALEEIEVTFKGVAFGCNSINSCPQIRYD